VNESRWSAERVVELALALAHDPARFERLSQREWRSVYRCPTASGDSVVLKLWARPGWKGSVRRGLQTSAPDHEWRSLCRARELGVRVPAPLGKSSLPSNAAQFTSAMVTADLGRCVMAVNHVKQLLERGAHAELEAFEAELVAQTALMVEGGLLDTDHGLVNTVVPASGTPVRLDFEMARQVRWPRLHRSTYAKMLGHLLTTHAFAVQPATERTERFAARLVARLAPPASVLRLARRYVEERMRIQEQRIGLAVRVPLPW
jgi:hypothetical protein